MDRKTQEARLNQAAEQWARLDPEGNEAARQALYGEIFTLTFQLYDQSGEMWVLDAFEEAMEKFDPERALFSHYFVHLLSKRKVDAHRYEQRHSPAGISLETPTEEDEQSELKDFLEDTTIRKPGDVLAFESSFLELTSMILNFTQCHTGKSANETRRNWYRMFYTEDMTHAVKSVEFHFLHERDMFAAMKQPYLDYYMSAPCTTGVQLRNTALRPYGQVVPERAGETRETPLPIPADVSLSYLRLREGIQAGASTRSNQLKCYKEEKELMRPC